MRRAVPTPRRKEQASRRSKLGTPHLSDGCAAAVDQFLVVARDDHAVVVAAEVRHIADWLQGILCEYECATFQPLEAAKDLQDVLSVVGNVHRLAVDPDILEALDRRPGGRIEEVSDLKPLFPLPWYVESM